MTEAFRQNGHQACLSPDSNASKQLAKTPDKPVLARLSPRGLQVAILNPQANSTKTLAWLSALHAPRYWRNCVPCRYP